VMQANQSTKQSRLLSILLLSAISVFGVSRSWAQSGRGTLTGSVTDTSGAIIPNVAVNLTEPSTASNYKTVTNAQGLFNFPELPPGLYNVSTSAPSFKRYTQDGITVSVGGTASLIIALQVGAATESVTVMSDASQLQTESSDVGTTVSTQLIEESSAPV
jgi:Carboxypeptidase regulatory-like domain